MPKLNKTQTALLARKSRHGTICTSRGAGSGGGGGLITFGIRESNAAHGLLRMGMIEFVKHDKEIHYVNGYGMHCTDTTWRVLEKE
jgi:hypothetical protein